MGMTPEKQNCMHQKIKSRLNSGTAYYNLVQNLLSAHCCLRIYILKYTELYSCLLFYESKTVLILGQGCRLRMLENVALRIIYEPKRDEVTVEWRQLQNKELHECTPHQILFRTHVEHVAHMGKNTNAYI